MGKAMGRCCHQRGNENHSLETPPYRLGHGTHQKNWVPFAFNLFALLKVSRARFSAHAAEERAAGVN